MPDLITPYRFYIDLSAGGQNLRMWLENSETANAVMALLAKNPSVSFAELWDSQEHRVKKRLRD